jgi:hypothetical protein
MPQEIKGEDGAIYAVPKDCIWVREIVETDERYVYPYTLRLLRVPDIVSVRALPESVQAEGSIIYVREIGPVLVRDLLFDIAQWMRDAPNC